MKASRKILYLFVTLAGMTCLSSCESLLDIPQKGVRPMEGFYQTDEDCQEDDGHRRSDDDLLAGHSSPSFFMMYLLVNMMLNANRMVIAPT